MGDQYHMSYVVIEIKTIVTKAGVTKSWLAVLPRGSEPGVCFLC